MQKHDNGLKQHPHRREGLRQLIQFHLSWTQCYSRTHRCPWGTAAGHVGGLVVLEESLRGDDTDRRLKSSWGREDRAEGRRRRRKRRWFQSEDDGGASSGIGRRRRRQRAGRPERMDRRSSEDEDQLQHDSSVRQLHIHRSEQVNSQVFQKIRGLLNELKT